MLVRVRSVAGTEGRIAVAQPYALERIIMRRFRLERARTADRP